MSDLNPLLKAYYLIRYLGPRVITLRAGVYLDQWRGVTAKLYAPRPWETIQLGELVTPGVPTDIDGYARFKREQNLPFLFPLGRPPEIPDAIRHAPTDRSPTLRERLDALAEMRPIYFFRRPSPEPIDWYHNPIDDKRTDPNLKWFETPDFAPAQGDMRVMWEPARAAWAFDLARARLHGHEIDAAGLLWKWVDSWAQACPPFIGFQWRCGQESSVRFVALALAMWTLADDPATTSERWTQMARIAWATGHRVAHHINYAISQKNNHALSEACGLMLVAHLFPEFRESAAWWRRGREVMVAEIRRQVYDDGAYVQSSMNYHRVMLDVAVLAARLAELAGEPFPRDVYERVGRAGAFLYQMMEPSTGRLPLYGNNDGAHVLPLTECDFTDYRPVVQAVHYLVARERFFEPGPWDEQLLWLFGPDALVAPQTTRPIPVSSRFDAGGYYTLRRPTTWAMTRCHTYRDRVHQIDTLHVDLWWRGINVLRDCGSYRYYTPDNPAIERYFKSIAAHNTVEVDGRDPLHLVSRFLWLPWIRARLRGYVGQGDYLVVEGEHYAYTRLPGRVVHRRTIVSLSGERWAIVDDVLGHGEHRLTLRWHLADFPVRQESSRVTLEMPQGPCTLAVAGRTPQAIAACEVVRGLVMRDPVQGLASPYYVDAEPIPVLEVHTAGELPIRLVTVFSPGATADVSLERSDTAGELWAVGGAGTSRLHLAHPVATAPRTLLEVS